MSLEYQPQCLPYDSNVATFDRCLYSTILAEFSWYSEALVLKPESILAHSEKLAGFETFLNSLHGFESTLLHFENNSHMSDTLELLGLKVIRTEISDLHASPVVISSHQPTLTPIEFQKICSVLCAYRLFELISLRAQCVSRAPISPPTTCMHLPGPPSTKELPDAFSFLQDWPKLTKTFQTLVTKRQEGGSQFRSFSNPIFSLMHMVAKNHGSTKYLAIEENFLLAAMHLAAMKYIPFAEGTLPDLPADIPRMPPGVFEQQHVEVFESEYDAFIQKCRTQGCLSLAASVALRTPLQLALMISPLYLLVTRRLSIKSFHRRTIISLAAKLGTNKPPHLLAVENVIWDAVFRLAEGRTPVYTVLYDLSNSLPWSNITEAMDSDTDKHWFALPSLPVLPAMSMLPPHNNSPPHFTAPSSPPTHVDSDLDPMDLLLDSTNAQSSGLSPVKITVDLTGPPHFTAPSTPLTLVDSDLDPMDLHLNSTNARSSGHSPINITVDSTETVMSHVNSGVHGTSPRNFPHNVDSLSVALPTSSDFPNPTRILEDMGSVYDSPEARDLIQPANNMQDDGDVPMHEPGPMQSNSDSESRRPANSQAGGHPHCNNSDPIRRVPGDDDDNENKICPTSTGTSVLTDSQRSLGIVNDVVSEDVDASKDDKPSQKCNLRGASSPRKPKIPTSLKEGMSVSKKTRGGGNRNKKRRRSSSTVVPDASGSKENPIDVDKIASLWEPTVLHDYVKGEPLSLSLSRVPLIKGIRTYTVFDVTGVPMSITPSFHYKVYHDRFHQFLQRVENFYDHNLPLHITRPEDSIIKHFTYDAWKALTPVQIQHELKKKNIIVTGWPLPENISFDEKGSRGIAGAPTRQISINDYSVEPPKQSSQPTVVSGRVMDMFDNPSGKILNALDLPLHKGDINPTEYTSDMHAWDFTLGHHHISHASPYMYPTGEMRWALIGHENTITWLHIDCEGLCTDLTVACGGKVWGFLRERPGNPLSSINFFLDPHFRLDEVTRSSKYDFEAVALRPGDKLFMMPCQPHFVYGYAHTICIGGHYYFTEHMQRTLQGLVHAFILHRFLTNISHGMRILLRRMIILYHMGLIEDLVPESDPAASHLPDINSIDGIMNLLSGCALVILGNVLDFRTYSAPRQEQDSQPDKEQQILLDMDINEIPLSERFAICYARGVALRLCDWIRTCAKILDPNGIVVTDLPSRFFIQIAQSLLMYKKGANSSKLDIQANCTLGTLRTQVENVVNVDTRFSAMWSQRQTIPSDSLELLNQEEYTVQWRPDSQRHWASLPNTFLTDGITELDQRCFSALEDYQSFQKLSYFPSLGNGSRPSKLAKTG